MIRKMIFAASLLVLFAVPVSGDEEMIKPASIWASSTLYDGIGDYSPGYVQDYNSSTAWVEGVAGNGVGEYLGFEVPAGTVISGVFLSPGYLKNEDIFYKNSAPSKLMVYSGSDGSRMIDCSYMAGTYFKNSDANWGYFYFDEPLISSGTVFVEIVEVREGWKYSDTCINELQLLTGGNTNYNNDYPGPDSDLDWYKEGKLFYGSGVLVSTEYRADGSFQIVRNDGRNVYRYDFTRNGYDRIEDNGGITYTIPSQKVLFTYYPEEGYLYFHTRYEDEYYY